jgi:parvulin-like peptidyl-prolyl isomerase
MRKLLFAALLLAAPACKNNKSKLDNLPAGTKVTTSGSGSGSAAAENWIDIDSKDILNRQEASPAVQVKHVLLAWKELDNTVYNGRIDKRAANRTNAEAAKLAQEIADKLRKNPDSIDQLVQEYSEDPGSKGGDPYEVKADAPFVPEFKALALHLKDKEVGIVRTRFGYHVMERVPPPPPDPLESPDVMARQPRPGTATIQHVVIGWKDTQAQQTGRGDPRAAERTKADADKLAQEVLAKAKDAKADMKALMKQYSEDAASKDSGRTIPIEENAQMPAPFENLKKMALRLNDNEAAMVKSPMGWHVIKRLPPPPPDALESAAILKRAPETQKARVKHILLNWKDNPDGPGENEKAKTRTRPQLEALVKGTIAKLNKGAAIEALMKELSEDPGSAASGDSYEVTPDAGLVEPFKNLSLRLKAKEVGAVKTNFGIHIIQRCTDDAADKAAPCTGGAAAPAGGAPPAGGATKAPAGGAAPPAGGATPAPPPPTPAPPAGGATKAPAPAPAPPPPPAGSAQ